jgi:hypothetical protein
MIELSFAIVAFLFTLAVAGALLLAHPAVACQGNNC